MEKSELVEKIVYVLQYADCATVRKIYSLAIRIIGYDAIFGGTK